MAIPEQAAVTISIAIGKSPLGAARLIIGSLALDGEIGIARKYTCGEHLAHGPYVQQFSHTVAAPYPLGHLYPIAYWVTYRYRRRP